MADKESSRVMSEVAFKIINEDILSVERALKELRETTPKIGEGIIKDLQENVDGLNKALNSVPETFDTIFYKKFNETLTLVEKLSNVSEQIKIDHERAAMRSVEVQKEQIVEAVKKGVSESNKKTVMNTFYACLGSGVLSAFFVWYLFPKFLT
jgi:uncharacterized protein YicC (UPF0701 family)